MHDSSVSEKIIARLSLYRRLLSNLLLDGVRNVYSHQLATMAGVSAAQVRRDMMAVGYSGTPVKGYSIPELIESVDRLLDSTHGQAVAIVGLGNLGRAVAAYFAHRRPNLSVVAAFDTDERKVGRTFNGCDCFHISEFPRVADEKHIAVAVITVPAQAAQPVADLLARSGIKGMLNFAPVRLRVPPDVYVENMDMAVSLEKAAYFARQGVPKRRGQSQ
jgi:redox-sensing transcriptional repressor